jgi:hypothetical protein
MRSRVFGDKSKFFVDEGLARVSILLGLQNANIVDSLADQIGRYPFG